MSQSINLPSPDDFQNLRNEFRDLKNTVLLAMRDKTNQKSEKWIPRLEFMERTNIKASTFNQLKNQGRLNLNRVGRKLYVDVQNVDDFFESRLTKKKNPSS